MSNAKTSGDGGKAPCNETSIVDSLNSKNDEFGESVEYVHDPEKLWFVLRATFGRSEKAFDIVKSAGFHAFLPMRVMETKKQGRLARVLKPLIPNMLFVYSEKQLIKDFIKNNVEDSFVGFYYNHFEQESSGVDKLLTIPVGQMDNFIMATRVRNQHVMLVDTSKVKFKSGDTVRIVEGDFIGVTGKVARVKGQQRVVVTLDGVVAIATAYIPAAFLEKYDSSAY